jgi:hypothetical protein
MSWFHLTVEFDSPIVIDLRAEASSSAQRLQKIAAKVGVPVLEKSQSFFDLADPMSRILTMIETGAFNSAVTVSALYTPGVIQDDIRIILTHWSIATGRDLKTRKGSST